MIAKKDIVIFAIVLVLAIGITLGSYRPGFLWNAANFTFGIGIVYIIIGSSVIVKNLGLFQSVSYSKYRRDFRKYGDADHSAKPLSFGEFVMDREKNRLPYKGYFFIGAPFILISILLGQMFTSV